jgi:hypothetical protein
MGTYKEKKDGGEDLLCLEPFLSRNITLVYIKIN